MHFLPRPPPFLPRTPLFLPTNFLGASVLYSETITTIRTRSRRSQHVPCTPHTREWSQTRIQVKIRRLEIIGELDHNSLPNYLILPGCIILISPQRRNPEHCEDHGHNCHGHDHHGSGHSHEQGHSHPTEGHSHGDGQVCHHNHGHSHEGGGHQCEHEHSEMQSGVQERWLYDCIDTGNVPNVVVCTDILGFALSENQTE